MHSPQESQLYYSWSKFYDVVFGPVLIPGIYQTIRNLNIPRGARVLELGVGTGLSLRAYPKHAQIVGIDASEKMLERAQETVNRQGWRHVTLHQMNALDLDFEDGSFDYVMAFHILTVVDDYHRLLEEMARVSKVNATIVIVNYLRNEKGWSTKLLDWIDPLTRRLGWQTTISYSNLLGEVPIQVVRRFKTAPGSLFTVVIAKRTAEELSPSPVPAVPQRAMSSQA
jgi:phosphatidylethanolamine/phosphatidyl-N-methylethanolamine N-methyltransferase